MFRRMILVLAVLGAAALAGSASVAEAGGCHRGGYYGGYHGHYRGYPGYYRSVRYYRGPAYGYYGRGLYGRPYYGGSGLSFSIGF